MELRQLKIEGIFILLLKAQFEQPSFQFLKSNDYKKYIFWKFNI